MEHYEFNENLKPLAEKMDNCLFWMGEPAYAGDEGAERIKGIKENCTNLEREFSDSKLENSEPELGIKLLSGFMKLINN